jgi:hypothetical protein
MDWKQLLVSITRSVDQELRLRNEYLASENRILRYQISGRMQLSDSDRRVLAEIGKKLGKKALDEIATVATTETILAWHRKFIDQKGHTSKPPKSLGRPRMNQEIEDLVVRMARENRSWGYDRIVGALVNLGYTISDQTVGNILKRHSIPPAPERKKTVTWREFIRIHMDVLGATDFFTSEIWRGLGLLMASLLCCIRFASQHVNAVERILHQWRHEVHSLVPCSRCMGSNTEMGLWDHDVDPIMDHPMLHRSSRHDEIYTHTRCRAPTPPPRHGHSGVLVGSSFQADTGWPDAMSTTPQYPMER